MKKEERLKRQHEIIAKINNAVMFEALTLTRCKITKEHHKELDTVTRNAIIKYKKDVQDKITTRRGENAV